MLSVLARNYNWELYYTELQLELNFDVLYTVAGVTFFIFELKRKSTKIDYWTKKTAL